MNPSSLLPDSFAMDCPVTTDGDYINSHVTGFPTDDEDSSQRVGGFSSMPVTNGVRYHAQQPAMQDLHQPPTGMSTTMQAPGHAVNSIPALMGRSNAYSNSYTLHRGMGLPLTGVNDVSRAHGFSGTPRGLDGLDRTQTALFQQPQPIVESSHRSQAQVEAPPFEETNVLESIVADFGTSQQILKPDVQAKIGRGFFASDGKWTCYRRNYFAVTCSFSFQPWPSTVPLYIRHSDQTMEPIRGFAMSISAIVNGQYGDTRELVQHTPKRDKQSERKPGRVVLQPSPPQSLMAGATGNGTHGFSLGSQSLDYTSAFTGAPQPCQPPQSHMFERIQFQKATANNGKRRAQQQYYNLVVELHAEVAGPVSGESQWVQIARRHSHPMVVRGRSPGHYKDGRRDSTTSMGPDGGSGEGPGGSLPHGMGQATRSHLLLYDSAHRGGLPYGRTDYRQMTTAEHSPLSDSPLVSSSSSSGFDYSMLNDTMDPMDTLKTSSTLDPYQDPVFTGVTNHHRPSAGGYDPVYSTYGRYDPIQNPHSLCT
ncbi:p53-like transcription factor DNA-binding [Penicillium macrosclerotiorum]|uniref:p53-like transcription factor DNA-binding n=1 Tax=Penicillium macrosclerotiorum TaxID=303699 RepID=UPI0025487E3F|nr:p53-like transcription factor DNA-binding [Penicillium macrosclerotiorum]KAJ5673735.1 p53-like transcription factor DNA-binding [Penicillium macrosclerotiorum]